MYFGKNSFGLGTRLKEIFLSYYYISKNIQVFLIDSHWSPMLIQGLSLLRTKGNIRWPRSFIPLFHNYFVGIKIAHLFVWLAWKRVGLAAGQNIGVQKATHCWAQFYFCCPCGSPWGLKIRGLAQRRSENHLKKNHKGGSSRTWALTTQGWTCTKVLTILAASQFKLPLRWDSTEMAGFCFYPKKGGKA